MLDQVTPSRSLESPATLARRASPVPGTDHRPDLLLIERARAGDEAAIEALIRRYARRLFRVARSVIPDDERATVIVQEGYLSAFADLTRYEPTGKFAAWLTRLAYQHARLQRSGMRSSTANPAAPGAPLADAAAELSTLGELEHAIAGLPEVFRTVFVLRVLEGISGIETAASLGVHETTVRTRLYRAHRRLDAELVRRLRTAPALLDLPAARLERLVSGVLAHLSRGAKHNLPAAPP
jgi:RNA polymerase sigma-70 factor (ECF subfamily)